MKSKAIITPFETDPTKWYTDLVLKGDLIAYGPVKGTMFLKPRATMLWNLIRKELTSEFNKLGIEEVMFPLLFPESLLEREKNHIKGFAPEVLTVTRVGKEKLKEALIIRPTSEILFGTYFKKQLTSYKQLPLLLNQWANIMRWENNTRPFLRNSEFHWQEGHTIHAKVEDAKKFSETIWFLYKKFLTESCLLPVFVGLKTPTETFAGADFTYTVETILKDGQALQTATSHYLGNNFTKAFDVEVLGPDNKHYYPFGTSWGISTRLIGALIMTHSDNDGLCLPSKLAPIQIYISLLFVKNHPELKSAIKKFFMPLNYLNYLKKNKKPIADIERIEKTWSELYDNNNFRIEINDNPDLNRNEKFIKAKLSGAPLIIEFGPNDYEKKQITIYKRSKLSEPIIKNLKDFNFDIYTYKNITFDDLMIDNDKILKEKAKLNFDNHKVNINDISELEENLIKQKYCLAPWEENPNQEENIKRKYGATIRCLIQLENPEKAINSNKKTSYQAVIARAY